MYREMRFFSETLLLQNDLLGGAPRPWRYTNLCNRIQGIRRLGATLQPTRAMLRRRVILDALEHFEDQTETGL